VSAVTEHFGQALAQSEAFRAGMANLKGAAAVAAAPLVQALAPALGAVANAAALALHYVAQLVAFFTGGSVKGFAAAAKSMNAFAGGAAKAKRSLAGFDQINKLSDSSGGGSDIGDIAANFDFSGSSPFLETVKNAIQNGDWAGVGSIFAAKMNEILTGWNSAEWGAKAGTVLQHGIDTAGTFLQQGDWPLLGQRIAEGFGGAIGNIDPQMLGVLLCSRFTIALQLLGGFLEHLDWAQAAGWLSGVAIGLIDALATAIETTDWNRVGTGMATGLANIDWAGLSAATGHLMGAMIYAAFQFCGGLLGGAWDWLKETFLSGWTDAMDHPERYEDTGAQVMAGLLQGILSVMAGIGKWVWTNVFVPFGSAIADAFDMHSPSREADVWGQNIMLGLFGGVIATIANKTASIKESLVSAFKGAVNGAIDVVNRFIGWLNSALSFSWDGLVIKGKQIIPGGSIQLANLPTIPHLAQGAVIPPNREFLAVLGDQPHGTNIEAPLETIQQALANVLAQYGPGDITITFTGDLAQLGRVLKPVIDKEGRRVGASLVKGGSMA